MGVHQWQEQSFQITEQGEWTVGFCGWTPGHRILFYLSLAAITSPAPRLTHPQGCSVWPSPGCSHAEDPLVPPTEDVEL